MCGRLGYGRIALVDRCAPCVAFLGRASRGAARAARTGAGDPRTAPNDWTPMTQKIITFGIPCYNSADYMDHCIESIL